MSLFTFVFEFELDPEFDADRDPDPPGLPEFSLLADPEAETEPEAVLEGDPDEFSGALGPTQPAIEPSPATLTDRPVMPLRNVRRFVVELPSVDEQSSGQSPAPSPSVTPAPPQRGDEAQSLPYAWPRPGKRRRHSRVR